MLIFNIFYRNNFVGFLAKQSQKQFFQKFCIPFPKKLYFCTRKREATLAQLVEQRIRNA